MMTMTALTSDEASMINNYTVEKMMKPKSKYFELRFELRDDGLLKYGERPCQNDSKMSDTCYWTHTFEYHFHSHVSLVRRFKKALRKEIMKHNVKKLNKIYKKTYR